MSIRRYHEPMDIGDWTLMDNEIKSVGSKIRLLKIWCGAHRAESAWKSTAEAVPEVRYILSVLSSISTYFHYSAMRSAELKKIASDRHMKLLNIPKIFEIRRNQFTFTFLRNILVSCQVLVIYFQRNIRDRQCEWFHNFLTKLSNLKLIAFSANVLFVFKRLIRSWNQRIKNQHPKCKVFMFMFFGLSVLSIISIFF